MSEIFKENGTKTSPFAIARYNKNFEYPYINASLALNQNHRFDMPRFNGSTGNKKAT